MNIKSKKIMSMMIIAVLVIIGAPHLSQAGLQANKGGSTLTHVKANDLFIEIRKMETQYGTLGKNAILDTTTYIDSVENGIDSHMILNTEYGTIAILAKSKYGQDSSSSNDTTTGNESGVFRLGGYGSGYSTVYENVAGIYTSTNEYTNIIGNADARYYNKYDSEISKPGDAMGIFTRWKNYPSSSNPILRRGTWFDMCNSEADEGRGEFYIAGTGSRNVGTRAVVVCGTGL